MIFLFLGLNDTISVLLAFSDGLFALTQSTVNFNMLICLLIFLSDLAMRSRFVSSAKSCTELNSTALCKSLINKIKRGGPRADP